MAKATAKCTCKTCGKTFLKETTKHNRAEADSWEAWAVANYDLCPDCWGKEQRAKEVARGLCARVALGNPYDSAPSCYVVFEGDTVPHKDALKALGCRWTQDYPTKQDGFAGGLLYGIGMSAPSFRWVAVFQIADDNALPAFFARIEAAGVSLADVAMPDATQISMWRSIIAHAQASRTAEQAEQARASAEKQAAIDAQLSSIGKIPSWDEDISALWPEGGKWNGKFYGKAGRWAIYIASQKIDLTDDQKQRMESTQAARAAWRERKKSIEGGA